MAKTDIKNVFSLDEKTKKVSVKTKPVKKKKIKKLYHPRKGWFEVK